MSCVRGCCATQAEHYRSLLLADPNRRALTKTVTDDHGTHQVDVTQHWHDRQDVLVKPRTVRVRMTQEG